jgi:putative transposase
LVGFITSWKNTVHNNKMEHINGEIRDREKTMLGLKIKRNLNPKRMPTIPHLIRPHIASDGKTPSEASGITIEGKNKGLH